MNSFLNIKNIEEFFLNREIFENIKKEFINSGDLENIEEYINTEISKNNCDEIIDYDYIINLILKLSKFEFLDKYNETIIFPLINILTESKTKIYLKKITNDNKIFGNFNRFINYEIEDNFDRLILLLIITILKQLSRIIVNQKSDIINGSFLILITGINDKLIKFL